MALDMRIVNGYPNFWDYQKHFGTWNNALKTAGLKINQTNEYRTGFETCCKCKNHLKQNQDWVTKDLPKGQVMCQSCYRNPDYKNGNLNKDTNVGKATISEQLVKNVLNLEEKYDCNFSYDFGYPIDLYHKEKYKYINVKDSKLNKDNAWHFNLSQKETPDTYIMLGYDNERKHILRVWITDPLDDLTYDKRMKILKKTISIKNDINNGLTRAKPWEVDCKPYDDMLHQMSKKRKDTNGEGCFLSNDDLLNKVF